MDYQPTDSKTLFKVFDATIRKRAKKKREAGDDNISLGTNESHTACHRVPERTTSSAKACLQHASSPQPADNHGDAAALRRRRNRNSSASESRSRSHVRRQSSSPRRHRKSQREATSLALKAGLTSTPRSGTPVRNAENVNEALPQEHESLIYAFLEDAVKKEKRKNRQSRRHEEHRYENESPREHRHHRHKKEKPPRNDVETKKIDPDELLETFAKLCSQYAEKATVIQDVPRTQSNKCLQCKVPSQKELYSRQYSAKHKNSSLEDILTPKVRSLERISKKTLHNNSCDNHLCDKCTNGNLYNERNNISHKRNEPVCYKNINLSPSRSHIARRNAEYYRDEAERINYRDFCDSSPDRNRLSLERDQKFHIPSDRSYVGEKESKLYCRPSKIREFDVRERQHDLRDNNINERNYYDTKRRVENYRNAYMKNVCCERISRRKNDNKFDQISVVSNDYKDKYSERERDSGLSIADGESIVSVKSNYFKSVKQEIAEQRESMDKMMQLWKELMRCVKSMSQNEKQNTVDNDVKEKAMNVRDSAAEHLRLWRECMQRYETVARDVGDTDARLKEEINKQRSEMSEMANMWQECLRRYRDISTDFNCLKQQLSVSDTPSRAPAPSAVHPGLCNETDIPQRAAPPYRQPPVNLYGQVPSQAPTPCPDVSQMHSRASVPPWWWYSQEPRCYSPARKRSSPDSRGSRERRRHKDRERDDGKYKEKSKAGASRSEHRHKKR